MAAVVDCRNIADSQPRLNISAACFPDSAMRQRRQAAAVFSASMAKVTQHHTPNRGEAEAADEEMPSPFPLAQALAEQAAQDEIQALVQHSFFRPYLSELLTAFAEARIDLLVLKGAALAETVYPRPSLRRYGDLDVLVRRADAARARTLLEGLGYIVDTLQWDALARNHDCQANFFKHTERSTVVVELHTDLINNDLFFGQVHVDRDGMWERARPAFLAGVEGRVLGPEDQLLHLCLHLAGHYFAAPQSLRDIAQVCGAGGIDWPLFAEIAQQARAAAACFGGMYAAGLLDASVPPSVLDALAPRAGRTRLEHLVSARVSDIAETQTDHLRFPLLWRLLDGPAGRVKALRGILFPSFPWLINHYYYDLYDDPTPPMLPASTRPKPAEVLRSLGVIGTLSRAHLRFLLRTLARSLRR